MHPSLPVSTLARSPVLRTVVTLGGGSCGGQRFAYRHALSTWLTVGVVGLCETRRLASRDIFPPPICRGTLVRKRLRRLFLKHTLARLLPIDRSLCSWLPGIPRYYRVLIVDRLRLAIGCSHCLAGSRAKQATAGNPSSA